MNKFAWISFSTNRESFIEFTKIRGIIDPSMPVENVDDFIKHLDPFIFLGFNVKSKNKKSQGFIISPALLFKQVHTLKREFVLGKLIKSVEIALSQGVNIIVLVGPLGVFLDDVRKCFLEKNVNFVNGKNYSTYIIIENLLRVIKLQNKEVKKSSVLVYDDSADFGRIAAQVLSKHMGCVYLFHKDKKIDKSIINNLKNKNLKIVNFDKVPFEKIDYYVNVCLNLPLYFLNNVKPGSVILDAVVPSLSANYVKSERKDLLAIEAGWSNKGPLKHEILEKIFAKDAVFTCLAEGAMLSLENKIKRDEIDFSAENVSKIGRISKKYGFGIPRFRNGDFLYEDKQINSFKKFRKI